MKWNGIAASACRPVCLVRSARPIPVSHRSFPDGQLLAALAAVLALSVLQGCSSGGEAPAGAPPGTPAGAQSQSPAQPKPAPEEQAKWTPPVHSGREGERDAMVRDIRRYGLDDETILKAMTAVPRHEFLPNARAASAYGDHPLPIGYGQTISQPYMVAEMTRLLQLTPDSRVLEVGTGSGYQAAVASHFTRHVFTIEIVKPLADSAGQRLKRLGYDVVTVRHGDGFEGWAEHAPFDAIIVTCAAGQVPPPLLAQLKPGGRMVIPIGAPFSQQELLFVEKGADGKVRSRSLMGVAFVPLLRKDPTEK
jgi:protein-L-isoaspartate(D-aspartate) O-methyltransferase